MELITADQRPQTYKDYPVEFKAEALLAVQVNGGNVSKTARDLGLTESTLRYWIEQETDACREIREGRKGELAAQFERVSRVYIDRALEPDAVAKTSGYYAVMAASDAMKSSQLLRNQPTSIVATVGASELNELIPVVSTIATEQRLTQHEAALKLAAQLADVPELAAMLTEWATQEKARQLAVSSASTGGDSSR